MTTNHKAELVKKFESEENLASSYVSRDSRRLLKEGKTKEDILKMVEAGELTSKTKAASGKRGRPSGVAAIKPAKVTKPKKVVEAEDEEEGDVEDEDIKEFLSGDENDK